MKCPNCKDINLVMSDRQGIEIDYCPDCRGVWLDRGELDKIIERSQATPSRSSRGGESKPDRSGRHGRDEYHYKKKKRKSLLGDLFDF